MRSLFMLLLVVNISYLIWGVAFSEKQESQRDNELPSGVPSISMLSENPESKLALHALAKKDLPTNKSTTDNLTQDQCFSIGPFVDEKKLNGLQERLMKRGIAYNAKSITDKEPKSYWVHMPPARTMADALKITEKLQAAKFNDYFVIRKGKNARAVSLGLYKSFGRAKQIKDQLKELGVESKVETRYREITRHWLDYQENKSAPLSEKVWKQADKEIVLQKVARPCEGTLPKGG